MRASGAAAAVAMKPSSTTGMPWRRAASVAPRMAASSRPPSAMAARSGSDSALSWRASPASIAARFRARPVIVEPGAAPGPALAAAAEERRGQRRRRRGVADSHFAEADEVGRRRHGIGARGDRFDKLGLGHGLGLGEVGGRRVEPQWNDAKRGADSLADLVDGGTAPLEIGDHLAR